MKKLIWLSRHALTNGQIETLKQIAYTEIEQHNVTFNDDIINQIQSITDEKTIAIVAPLSYSLKLLRAGYTLIEFQNIPSARSKGVFLCKGLFVHTLESSLFIKCPLSVEEQEKGSLVPIK